MAEDESALETIIADRFAVDLANPLPEFDTVGAAAYGARDVVSDGRPVYALVQRRGWPRRENLVSKLMGRPIRGLVCPRGDGLMMVNDGDGRGLRLVTIMDRPTGGRVVDNMAGFAPVNEQVLRGVIIPQVFETLEALAARNVAHRSVSLRNLYYRNPDHTEVVLTECCSAPPAYHQDPVYEPIERALAMPAGRGEGDVAADMYAFGVMILSLQCGSDTATSANRQDNLETRIMSGSFWALSGQRTTGGTVNELVRGLMEDNPTRRWGEAEVRGWMNGLVPRKTVGDMGWTLARPVMFRRRHYKDRRALALALLNHPAEALEVVHGDKFLHTISLALAEGPTRDWLERALDLDGSRGVALGGPAESMGLARVMAVLFPEAPICFGRLKVCPDGFGPALAADFASNDTTLLNDWNSLVDKGRFGALLDVIGKRNAAQQVSILKLEGMQRLASDRQLGRGLERTLYELNKSLPCQSSKVRNRHVDSLRKLLLALDEAAGQSELGVSLVDRHVAAFIVRHEDAYEGAFQDLERAAERPEAYMFETLKLFGSLQQKQHPYPLKNIARGFRTALNRAIGEIRSRTRRKQAQTAVDALLEKGNLARIAQELDLAALRRQDQREFRNAQSYYGRLSQLMRRLEQPVSSTDPRMRGLGNRFMAYAAIFTLMVVTSLAVLSGRGGV